MKISFNDAKPWFSVQSDQIVKDTIEGVALRSLVDKYNLETELMDEHWTWGRKDENGRFNGVIGRVYLFNLRCLHIMINM